MTTSKELRIGNWVLYQKTEHIKIDGIQPRWIWFKDFNSCSISDIQPILLTHEIFKKAGFEPIEEDIFGPKCLYYHLGEVVISDDFKLSGQNMPSLKYVHQLQNLYYSLTGEELEINL